MHELRERILQVHNDSDMSFPSRKKAFMQIRYEALSRCSKYLQLQLQHDGFGGARESPSPPMVGLEPHLRQIILHQSIKNSIIILLRVQIFVHHLIRSTSTAGSFGSARNLGWSTGGHMSAGSADSRTIAHHAATSPTTGRCWRLRRELPTSTPKSKYSFSNFFWSGVQRTTVTRPAPPFHAADFFWKKKSIQSTVVFGKSST